MRGRIQKRSPSRKGAKHGRRIIEDSEKTVEQIFDERYPLDKWEDSNYSILDKFSMRGRKGFVTGAAGGLGRNAAAALALSRSRRRTSRPAQPRRQAHRTGERHERTFRHQRHRAHLRRHQRRTSSRTQNTIGRTTPEPSTSRSSTPESTYRATIKTPPKKYGRAPSTSTSTAPTVPAASRMKSCANTVMAAH